MKKTKQDKAITLIALIITIVILLIISVVTINAIQGDEGLITKANNSVKKYKKSAEEENSLIQKYLNKMSGEDSNDDQESEDDIPIELKEYILGKDGEGKSIYDIIVDLETFSFINDEETIPNAQDDIECVGGHIISNKLLCYIKYNNEYYKFNCTILQNKYNLEVETNTLAKVANYDRNSKVGKYIKVGWILWRVIYDDNVNGLQMVCETLETNTSYNNKLTIGYCGSSSDDNSIKYILEEDFNLADTDGNGTLDKKEVSIYAFNNSIKILNSKCEKEVLRGIDSEYIDDVRCIGTNPTNKNENTLISDCDDIDRMTMLGNFDIDTNAIYSVFFATVPERNIVVNEEDNTYFDFCVYDCGLYTDVEHENNYQSYYCKGRVRPVIKLKSNVEFISRRWN